MGTAAHPSPPRGAGGVARERPIGWQFNGVSFVDRNIGLVVGEHGVIFRTVDGGATWAYQGDPVYGRLTDVDLLDEVHAEIAGTVIGPDEETYLALGTVDGGQNWTFQRSGSPTDKDIPINLQAIGFLGEPRRIVAVGHGRIFVSFDGGATWRSRRSGTHERLDGVAFADRRRGIAVGSVVFPDSARGRSWPPTTGARAWHPRPTPEADYPIDVTFADATTAYVVGCQGGIAPCRQGAILRVDFPELELEVEQPQRGRRCCRSSSWGGVGDRGRRLRGRPAPALSERRKRYESVKVTVPVAVGEEMFGVLLKHTA